MQKPGCRFNLHGFAKRSHPIQGSLHIFERLWPLRLSAHHGSAERGGLGRERVAGSPHLATRGIEGPRQATETTAAVVGQWLVHPAAAGTAEARLGLRLRRGSNVRREEISHAQHRRRVHTRVPGDQGRAQPELDGCDRPWPLCFCCAGCRLTFAPIRDRSSSPKR